MKTIPSKPQIPEFILGIKLQEKSRQDLVEGKETELIRGFKHKNGETFDAFLTLNPENKLVFRISENIRGAIDEKENYKSQICLADFALIYGFVPSLEAHDSELSVYDYLLMTGPRGERIIIHKELQSLEFKFFALDIPGLSGHIYDFLECFTHNLPEENRKILENYLDSPRKAQYFFLPSVHNLETAFCSVFQLESLQSKDFFLEKGLKDTTLDHSFFRGRVFSKTIKGDNEIHEEPCFPLYSEGKMVDWGFFMHLNSPIQETKQGIWYSNIINPEKVRRLIVFNHPLEAFFYHQIYSKPSDLFTVYASVLGEKNEDQIGKLQFLIDECKPENVIIATSDDLKGLLWENALLGGLVEPREYNSKTNILQESSSEIRFSLELLETRSDAYCLLKVNLTYNDLEKGILMNENLLKYFTQINEKEIKEHPELENHPPFIFSKKIISRHESIAPVTFAYKKEYLGIISKVIQHLRPILFLKLEKPQQGLFEKTLRHQNEERLVFKEMKARKIG